MKLEFKVYKKTLLVRVRGELDMVAADHFRCEVDENMEKNCCDNLILNLDQLNFIDSSGLGVILGRYKKLAALGGKLAIVGAPPQVKRILELSGLLRIASAHENETEALQAM